MIRWTGLAPWEFEFPFPGSLTSTFLVGQDIRRNVPAFPRIASRRVLWVLLVLLVFKAHRLMYHSTLGLRAMQKKKDVDPRVGDARNPSSSALLSSLELSDT